MALYYWLGQTGNGNVNLAANWSLWGPTGATATLPPSSSTIPKYNDSVKFSKYTIGATGLYFPIFGPSGQLNGLCGPAGNTAAQFLLSVQVDDDCPVALGSSASYFKFRTQSLKLNVGTAGIGSTLPSYIDLLSGDGVTQANTTITVFAKKEYDYYIKGVADRIYITNTAAIPSYSRLYLANLELTAAAWTITDVPSPNYNSYDKIYLYPTTSASTAAIKLYGKGIELHVQKGFSWSEGEVYLYADNTGSVGPQMFFDVETIGSTASGGPTSSSRTYMKYLYTYGATKIFPKVFVNHGVDFVYLDHNGGVVNFNQEPTDDTCVVQKGQINAAYAKITSPYGTVNLGSNGGIIVQNTAQNTPDIVLGNISNYVISPVLGYTGSPG